MSWNGFENNMLMRNDGPGPDGVPHFTEVAMALGADTTESGRGVALLDHDNDGDIDVAIMNNPGDPDLHAVVRPILYRNEIGSRRSWIAVQLEGTKSNRDGIGATVVAEADGTKHLALVSAGSGYAGQHQRRITLGLDRANRVDHLTVHWPSGTVETFDNLPARSLVHVTEGAGVRVAPLPGRVQPTAVGN